MAEAVLIVDRDELMAELAAASARFEALLRSLEPSDMNKSVPGMTWNVGETAVHVVVIAQRCYMDLRRSASPAGTAELNSATIDEIRERNPVKLADMFAEHMEIALEKIFPRVPDDREFPFHANTMTTIRPAMSVVLGELLIHGNDIASATDQPWEITPRAAYLIWLGAMDAAYGWLRDDVDETSYLIHFEGQDVAVLLQIARGKVHVQAADGQTADHTLTVEPIEFLLTFPYGRIESDDPVIAQLCSCFHPL